MVSVSSFDRGRSPSVSLQLSQIPAVHTRDSPLQRVGEGGREGGREREEGK